PAFAGESPLQTKRTGPGGPWHGCAVRSRQALPRATGDAKTARVDGASFAVATGGFRRRARTGNGVLQWLPALCPAGKGSNPAMKRRLAQAVLIVIVLVVAGMMMRIITGMRPQVAAAPIERRVVPVVVQRAQPGS